MSKFKKGGKKASPAINTSSLPDIVFMLLFFFMVATTTKEIDPLVKVKPALGVGTNDLTPFKQRSEVDFIYIGKPNKGGSDVVLQFDNIIKPVAHLAEWKEAKYTDKAGKVTVPLSEVITCFKMDEEAPVDVLFQCRKILRDMEAFSIAYAAAEKGNNKGYGITGF